MHQYRLSALGYEARDENVLPDPVCVLVPTIACSHPRVGKATQGLQRTCRAPLRHFVHGWVRKYAFNLLLTECLHRASYILNLTYIGAAIFMSMDIPDAFLAVRCSSI